MRLSRRFGELRGGRTGGLRDFSNALLPAERRGRENFRLSPVARERGVKKVSSLGLSFGDGSSPSLVFACWGFGSLLFDNRIGRKRDVGGGVLAGLQVVGLALRRELGNWPENWSPKRQLTVTFRQFIALRNKHARPS